MADLYTIIANTVAIVSDGSAVLGLGNLGPLAAMPVLEGKAALLAHLVGVNAIPIALRSQEADDIVEAAVAISPSFGVIQLEDIASPKCFDIEPRVQESVDVAVFHDDQHGTAAVVLAALINACRLAETPPRPAEHRADRSRRGGLRDRPRCHALHGKASTGRGPLAGGGRAARGRGRDRLGHRRGLRRSATW